jgi:dTDP-glucose 4,6-dehydratase
LVQNLRIADYRVELFNNYGPYQFPEKLIPLTILTPEGVFARVRQRRTRDWLHVDDHARGLIMLLEHGNRARSTTSR